MINPGTLTKEHIQDWLDQRHGGDREWLAKQMGITPGGLAHCFSKQGFSAKARASVARLMELDDAAQNQPALLDQVQLSVNEWDRMEEARQWQGNPARPIFIRESIVWFTNKVLEDKKWKERPSDAYRDDGAIAAEDPPDVLDDSREGKG